MNGNVHAPYPIGMTAREGPVLAAITVLWADQIVRVCLQHFPGEVETVQLYPESGNQRDLLNYLIVRNYATIRFFLLGYCIVFRNPPDMTDSIYAASIAEGACAIHRTVPSIPLEDFVTPFLSIRGHFPPHPVPHFGVRNLSTAQMEATAATPPPLPGQASGGHGTQNDRNLTENIIDYVKLFPGLTQKMNDCVGFSMEQRSEFRPGRRTLIKIAAGLFLAPSAVGNIFSKPASPLQIANRFSRLNSQRPLRPHTDYIILHTTEGAENGSLNKIRRNGEANYFVCKSGTVYRIIDKNRIAKHTGRSMWDGKTTIDNYSIGIEVVGYHNKDITDAQYHALKELVRQLQSLYSIPDEKVLTHSMVAYGRPNKFHRYNHRGRKSCGMIFAQPEVRARLGLESQPDHDPDVKAGRLKVADKKLFSFLFPENLKPTLVASIEKPAPPPPAKIELPDESPIITGSNSAWQIARERYDHPSTLYTFPNGSKKRGDQIDNWAKIPTGTRVTLTEMEDNQPFEGFMEIGKDGDSANAVAGEAWTSATTIYFFPDGYIRTGAELQETAAGRRLLNNTPPKTLILVGYIYGGYVKARRSASNIAGRKWNYPSTYYRYPDGSIVNGDDIKQKSIPPKTLIFYQQ